jgi:hypothetical protein
MIAKAPFRRYKWTRVYHPKFAGEKSMCGNCKHIILCKKRVVLKIHVVCETPSDDDVLRYIEISDETLRELRVIL